MACDQKSTEAQSTSTQQQKIQQTVPSFLNQEMNRPRSCEAPQRRATSRDDDDHSDVDDERDRCFTIVSRIRDTGLSMHQ
jgi:hypothetical protein